MLDIIANLTVIMTTNSKYYCELINKKVPDDIDITQCKIYGVGEKMSKELKTIIRIECVNCEDLYSRGLLTELHTYDCPTIIKKFEGKKITNEELNYALDLITTYMARNNSCRLILEIDKREKQLTPPKEMTIKEIEKELGYKVKVVDDKESDEK